MLFSLRGLVVGLLLHPGVSRLVGQSFFTVCVHESRLGFAQASAFCACCKVGIRPRAGARGESATWQ